MTPTRTVLIKTTKTAPIPDKVVRVNTVPETISVEQAAQRIGVSKWVVYRWMRLPEGWAPTIHIGRSVRVSVAALDAWCAGGGS
jgi:excisionase family DNA binding protein